MTKLISAKCPSCGANLEFPEETEMGVCIYCGGKILISKSEIHYHEDVHQYYIANNFEQLKYNKDLLTQEIEELELQRQRAREYVNNLLLEWGAKVDSKKGWAKYFILAALGALILILVEVVCCSIIFISLLLIGIWIYFSASAPAEFNRYDDAKRRLSQLEIDINNQIAAKEKDIEEIERRMKSWK
jgi:DNA-directed RNA polymerase subunit RPC12/RpoP